MIIRAAKEGGVTRMPGIRILRIGPLRNLKTQLVAVTLITALSQLAAFVKLWVTARIFGVGVELDGYNLALVLPTLISGVLSGAFQTGLFPVHAKLAVDSDAESVMRFERSVLIGLFALGVGIAATVMTVAPLVLAWLGHGAQPAVREAAAFVLPFAALLIALNAVGDGLGYLLALRKRYPVAAAAPIANAALGAGLLAAWPEGGLLNLALGTVLGLALQVGICLVALDRVGFRLRGSLPGWAEAGREWKEMVRLGAWILPGVVFSNVTASFPPVLVAQYGAGAVSAFGYAYRLHSSAVQLLVMAASPVILASFSELVARRENETIRRLLTKTAGLSLALGACATAFVWLLGAPLLELVFGGRFDANAAKRVGDHWFWLTLGLAPAILGNVLAKLWQARRLPGLLSTLAGVGLITFLAASFLLSFVLRENAIAAGMTVSACVVVVAGWVVGIRSARGCEVRAAMTDAVTEKVR